MSKRFPDVVRCPHCGLEVAGKKSTGVIRGHATKAVAAGYADKPCALNSNAGQRAEAQKNQSVAAQRRADYWKSRDSDGKLNDYGTPQGPSNADPA